MLEVTIGVITFSVTTVLSFIVWLLRRRKDFKKLYESVKGEKAGVVENKETFKLKYNFYKKLIKLLERFIEEKYLRDIFTDGEVDYQKMIKDILDFVDGVGVGIDTGEVAE